MRQYTYKGFFENSNGNSYTLQVICNGFFEAFFLLTADAIRSGRHYQLKSISDEKGNFKNIGEITACANLIKD